jgi:6-phosphogluconolactonase (cycloisomerase 2 family)
MHNTGELMTETGPSPAWVLSGPDERGRSSARPLTLADDGPHLGAAVEIPARARFAARHGGLLYVVGDDGLAIVSTAGVALDRAALPPGVWCHIAVADDRLVSVDYTNALARLLRLAPDGTVAAVTDEISFTGRGRHAVRQQSAHPHQVLYLPDHRAVAIADLGSDRIWLRRFDADRERLLDAGAIVAPAGSGPRHARSTGPCSLAVACELSNSVALFERDPAAELGDGWTLTAEVPISGTATGSLASEIVISPDSRFAYVGTRGDERIGVVDIERCSLTQLVDAAGAFPQHLAFSGGTLLVANQRSDSLACFARDRADGRLRLMCSVPVSQPVCVL